MTTNAAVEAVWRIESSRVIATLARLTGDVGLAEDLAQDALIAALEQWPETGVPRNAGAWLTAVAKRRAIDGWRRQTALRERYQTLAHSLEETTDDDPDDVIRDDLLRLIFVSCHPVLQPSSRVALTLRLLGGLTTEEIARAFLVPSPTIGQRISRAKRTLSAAKVPFEVPDRSELKERLGAVLEVLYLIFNEGYAATSGDGWMRPGLCREALRLGRTLAELLPAEPEVHGLVALMEFQSSRLGARTAPDGSAILLQDQDRSRWNRLQITRGVAALARADSLGRARGPYVLQAALAACHATAPHSADTDWALIVALYDALSAIAPSPIVELNRAVAVSMASGPDAGLTAVDRLAGVGALAGYHLLPAVRGDLLAKLGRGPEARLEFERAASLTRNERERELLLGRAANTLAD
ncbi:RNA polymerase sigma factor [Glaciihabitans arcticus]|uniref:RNA polymerase sigma factor n=1 Tax=Glaciihabitans arcticus TaxID=2668039 RepID=A0A4Q9GU06_9MICO|nr:RNA polymerase sigma factor [Glaciihabitans arcticus]TBN58211.1 RNA polymerase sigma factor [Glaciihabitans arcticus]